MWFADAVFRLFSCGKAERHEVAINTINMLLHDALLGRCFRVAVGGKKGGSPCCPGCAAVASKVGGEAYLAGNSCLGDEIALFPGAEMALLLHKYSSQSPFLYTDAVCLCISFIF